MIQSIFLHQFRSHKKFETSFDSSMNWIVGSNGQGKTNLLEALYLLTTGRSFRTHKLGELIAHRLGHFYIEAKIIQDGVCSTLEVSFDGTKKKIKQDGNTSLHFSSLIGRLPHIIYSPEDVAILSGSPSSRRKLLDIHLSQIDPLYLWHLARYHKAIKQRNELLKQRTTDHIKPWEAVMAQSSFYLICERQKLIEALRGPLQEKVGLLTDGADQIDLIYEPSLSAKSPTELEDAWQELRPKELDSGSTLYGPHRDDLAFLLDGEKAKPFASQGQKHGIIASLRLCQWEQIKKAKGLSPLFSIDDFGSHLDAQRQERFEDQLQLLGQTFLTCPDQNTKRKGQIIKIA